MLGWVLRVALFNYLRLLSVLASLSFILGLSVFSADRLINLWSNLLLNVRKDETIKNPSDTGWKLDTSLSQKL